MDPALLHRQASVLSGIVSLSKAADYRVSNPDLASALPSLHVAYPRRQSRWRALLRLLLVTPHLLILSIYGALVAVTTVCAWFMILISGRYPAGLWRFGSGYMRRQAAVTGYVALLRDEYPPFDDREYAVQTTLAYLGRSSRISTLFRALLVLPAFLVLGVLQYVWVVVVIFAWIALSATGRQPWGLHRFGAGVLQWTLRTNAYALLLTDRYPPFTLGLERAQPSAAAFAAVSASPNAAASNS